MIDFNKIRKLFLYAGLEKEEYDLLVPGIRQENRILLKVFSQLGAVMFFLLFIASVLSGGFVSVNTPTYLICSIEMVAILLCSRFLLPKHPEYVMILVYLFEITLYVFGIHISMLHADKPAVSAVAFLLVSPLLFYDQPIRLTTLITIVVAVYCGMVLKYKAEDVAVNDIWNMITFGVVAIATTVFTMSIKIRALAQSRQIEYLSQTDLLTGVKNRNRYENRLQKYPEYCRNNLMCVYADVNGLHEINNREGHPAGDRMLCEVASAMRRLFGEEDTYRIGGDEFVAFRMDAQPEVLALEVERMKQELERKGYHVSFGSAVRDKSQGEIDMQALVNKAESRMFADKREFYRRSENDRRSR